MAEKIAAVKSKNRFFKLLPSFSPPLSPNKDKMIRSSEKHKSNIGKGYHGGAAPPTVSIIPADALKTRNSSFAEPTSPKVSCMGQVKHKKKLCSLMKNNKYYQDSAILPPLDHLNRMVQSHDHKSKPKSSTADLEEQNPYVLKSVKSFNDLKKKKKSLAIKQMFTRVPSGRRKSNAYDNSAVDQRPSCALRRFSSSRTTTLSNFDWTSAAQVEPVDSESCRQELDNMCAPKIIQECKAVCLEPKKEINLWKRRTMAQPKPLQLQALVS